MRDFDRIIAHGAEKIQTGSGGGNWFMVVRQNPTPTRQPRRHRSGIAGIWIVKNRHAVAGAG
jgi:hypothetical protein